jgi:hypothetical protein
VTILAASSGTVIFESGKKIYISKRPAQWTQTFLFVVGLLAFILLANGVMQFTVLKDEIAGSSTIGLGLVAGAIVFSLIFWRVRLYQKKINAIPPSKLETIAILDFENNNLLDHQQRVLAPLHQSWISRKMQLTSSSPELILCWNGGSISIAKGNPFSGGVSAIENALSTRGIKKR